MRVRELLQEGEGRPLIWGIVDGLLSKGYRVLFHAHMPNSSSHLLGKIRAVTAGHMVVDQITGTSRKNRLTVPFTADDDLNLTLRKVDVPTHVDYMVLDRKKEAE